MDREGKIPAAIKIKGKGTINFLDIQVALEKVSMPTGSRFSCFVSISVYYYTLSNIVIFLSNVLCVDKNTSYFAVLSFISFA